VLHFRTERTNQCGTNWEQKYRNMLWTKILDLRGD